MKQFFERALDNVIRHGDTDIFPFSFENLMFFDKRTQIVELLLEIHSNLEEKLAEYPPANAGALAPISYMGFRWATQIDPIWNIYFLGLVLAAAADIEKARISPSDGIVFSYRYSWDPETSDLFDTNFQWRSFMECSLKLTNEFSYVVTADISEFYLRLNHHRLENALKQALTDQHIAWSIMKFLGNFSNTNSYGIPVGGPASRILSELVLNQIDRLLRAEGIRFCRFADDFHIFCRSREEAYSNLLFLSDKLLHNQGLQLQKSKTRLMSNSEFKTTGAFHLEDEEPSTETAKPDVSTRARSFLRFSLRFDPYSATAKEDYEQLQQEIERFDILELLKAELSKTRIHISLARKIINAIKFIDPNRREEAILSLLDNAELLYPVFSSVMLVAKASFDVMSDDTQRSIIGQTLGLIRDQSHVLRVDLNLIYAVRLLGSRQVDGAEDTLSAIYKNTNSPLVRRDIILVMARWGAWFWLSDLRNSFRTLSPLERRAFILASYRLSDEGQHWRRFIKRELTPYETIIMEWAAEKVQKPRWVIPV